MGRKASQQQKKQAWQGGNMLMKILKISEVALQGVVKILSC